MRPSDAAWREERRRLNADRHGLARAAALLYPDLPRAGSTRLLTRDGWTPPEPLDLREVRLRWTDAAPAPAVRGREPEATALLPEGPNGYAEALGSLDRPRLFENRTCYRLLGVSWPELTFTRGCYFDGVDVGEAAGHEFAARAGRPPLPFRTLVGDPTDLGRRAALCAVSTLTLRHDRRTGEASFVLHWRDPARVAHGGGLYQVMPVGVFQPARESDRAVPADLDLWKCVVREYAEEFLGRDEEYGDDFDYETWPLYRRLTDAREDGRVRSLMLGVGVDPLTFATDFLAVTVIEAETFDALFGDIAASNSEGEVVGRVPFEADAVRRHVHDEPMQAAGAAVLDLAWRHREALL